MKLAYTLGLFVLLAALLAVPAVVAASGTDGAALAGQFVAAQATATTTNGGAANATPNTIPVTGGNFAQATVTPNTIPVTGGDYAQATTTPNTIPVTGGNFAQATSTATPGTIPVTGGDASTLGIMVLALGLLLAVTGILVRRFARPTA